MTEANNAAVAPPMGQCAITGKTVPEDELVTLHGYRVCAEGKAILLDRLKSGEMLPGQMEAPSVLRRFGCMFVDGLVIVIPAMILTAVAALASGGSVVAVQVVTLLITILQLSYFAMMHASSGQTVGKMAGKIKVVNLDGSPISSQTAWLRAIYYLGPGVIATLLVLVPVPIIAIVAALFRMGWIIADVVFALADPAQQRALHDRLAGTRVIAIG